MDHLSMAMDSTSRDIERDCAFGGLFQQIINEMKNSSPLWEDLTMKSTKLHSCLRATIQAVSAFLDAFQKIADAATSTKGATKDIGTALTRICLRHKALEAKLKTFTSSIFDCLIIPLQERLEEWKRVTINLDKEHAKEYKRGRSELKKRTIETLRLQKKVRKMGSHNGGMHNPNFSASRPSRSGSIGSESFQQFGEGGIRELHRALEIAMKDTNERRLGFEEMEKQAIRAALIEERSRFCLFVSFFKPVVDEEVEMLSELTHIQEAMQQLEKHAADPFSLPASSEQVIADLKSSCDSGNWSFNSPPSSPGSLGSRKSSLCSISSANSSSSGSMHSPQNFHYGNQNPLLQRVSQKIENHEESSPPSSNSSTPSLTYGAGTVSGITAAWPNVQDSLQFERAACAIMNERPHTISAAYERGQERPALTKYTYQEQPRDPSQQRTASHSSSPATPVADASQVQAGAMYQSATEIYGVSRGRNEVKPPVPKRASSLERVPSEFTSSDAIPPKTSSKPRKPARNHSVPAPESQHDKNVPALPDFNQSSEDMIVPQPVYVNMHELNQMAAARRLRQQELPPPPPELEQPQSVPFANTQHQHVTGGAGGEVGGNGMSVSKAIEATAEACRAMAAQYSRPSPEEKPQPPAAPARQASSLTSSPVRSHPTLSSPTLIISPFHQHILQQAQAAQANNANWAQGHAPAPDHSIQRIWHSADEPDASHAHQREGRSNSLDDALKHISVADTIKTLTERNHQPVSPNMSLVRRAHSLKQADERGSASPPHPPVQQIQQIPPNRAQPQQQPQQQHPISMNNVPNQTRKEKSPNQVHQYPQNQRMATHTHTHTQNLTDQPMSGAALPHNHSSPQPQPQSQPHPQQQQMQSQHINQLYQQLSVQPQQPIYQPAVQQQQSQSAQSTPRHPRRFSEELLKTTATFVQNHVLGNKTPPPIVSSKEIFVQTLNAKLSQMRGSPSPERRLSSPTVKTSLASKLITSVAHAHHHGFRGSEMSTASRVRHWIASKTISDPNMCRESLMDQIRRYDAGRLRHIRPAERCDRSAPRIR